MGAGAGVKFDVTLGHPNSFDLKAKGPDWVKKSDLGVKIGKKKEFTDCVVVPIEAVRLESAYSSANVESYSNPLSLGYLLIDAESINNAISEEMADFKERYHLGANLTEFSMVVDAVDTVMYSVGWARSPFPTDGMLDAKKVYITLYFEVLFEVEKDGEYTLYFEVKKDGKDVGTETIELSVEGTLYFPDHPGYIRGSEYDQITVRQAYTGLDELWDEDEDE